MKWIESYDSGVLGDMAERFSGAGLTLPPVPESLAPDLFSLGDWVWATRADAGSPYEIQQYAAKAEGEVAPYILVGHAGHGVQSVAMHYYLAVPGLVCLIQEPWGGVYTDDDYAADQLRQYFRLARILADDVAHAKDNPGLVVVQSRFMQSKLGVGQPGNRVWRNTATPLMDALDAL